MTIIIFQGEFLGIPLDFIIFPTLIIFTAIYITWRLATARSDLKEPITEAWILEAHGGTWAAPVIKEDAATITYKVAYGKGMEPVVETVTHSHAIQPYGSLSRIFLVPRGSHSALDPRQLVEGGIDRDDPGPIIDVAASWYKRLQDFLGQGGLKLKENWFTILMIGLAMFGMGVIIEAKFLLVPATP